MTDNPQQTPPAVPPDAPPAEAARAAQTGLAEDDRRQLRAIAKSQKGLLVCVLAYLGAILLNSPMIEGAGFAGPILGLVAWLGSVVFVFMLATKVYKPAVGIILGVLTLVPIVGLIVLLIVNGKATGILKHYGLRVGLLGADLSKI